MSEVIHTEGNVRLVQDDEPGEFPSWGDGGFQMLSYTPYGWITSSRIDADGMPGEEKFGRIQGATLGWYPDVIQRWLRAFYNPKATVKGYTGYSQGDYWLVVSMEGDTDTSDQIAAWAMGDVWRLALEYRAVYTLSHTTLDLTAYDVQDTIEVWVRDFDSGATAYGEADREAIIAEFKHEMEGIHAQP